MEYHLELLFCLVKTASEFAEKILTKELIPEKEQSNFRRVYRQLQWCSILCDEIVKTKEEIGRNKYD